jgi:hypothetical protein
MASKGVVVTLVPRVITCTGTRHVPWDLWVVALATKVPVFRLLRGLNGEEKA